jgi:AGCS family alanine or glycine:cation symporter
METLYADLTLWVTNTADNIWSMMVYVLFAAGLYLTIKTRFVQFRHFRDGVSLVFAGFAGKKSGGKKLGGDVSPIAALSTALAATVGNGNIGGVATALVTGGPGAIFWMWICGLVGMATKYAEAVLGVKYREHFPDGSIAGGPMYYIKNGVKYLRVAKILAPAFAVCGAFATLFGTGNMMQANQMALAFNSQLGVPKWLSGMIIAVLVGLVIIGGIKRIGSVAEKLVPTMIVIYFVFGFIVIFAHITYIPGVIVMIFKSAFTPAAAMGGFIGAGVKRAMQIGFRRGLLSNEAGLGSAPIAHAAAKTPSPVHQGLIAQGGVVIDTLIVCTLTAFINLSTGMWQSGLDGTAMTAASFSKTIPFAGGIVVAFSSFLFGYSTLLGWYYYGEQCMKFLFGIKVTLPYRVIYVSLIYIGSIISLELVFYIGDIANAFMAFPNLIGMVLLGGVLGAHTKNFFKKYPKISMYKD